MEEGTPIIATTPAGSQINCDWELLNVAIDALVSFLKAVGAEEPYVVFRCGTVVRVGDGDVEFKGYKNSDYRFPETDEKHADTVKQIMRDNARVWAVQKSLADASVSLAVRKAFATLVRQGYPWPGPGAERWGQQTRPGSPLLLVHWPELDSRGRVFNLGYGPDSEAQILAAGDLRRQDYMFPEVAAVVLPGERLAVWRYEGPKFQCKPH